MLNATEDVSNFFEGSSHLRYLRCPIKARAWPRVPMQLPAAAMPQSHAPVPLRRTTAFHSSHRRIAPTPPPKWPPTSPLPSSSSTAPGKPTVSTTRRLSSDVSIHKTSPARDSPARPAAAAGRALVHCRAGVSRSATVVIGYLMTTCKWDLKTALHHVDTKRFVQPNSGFINFLIGLERNLFGAPSPPWLRPAQCHSQQLHSALTKCPAAHTHQAPPRAPPPTLATPRRAEMAAYQSACRRPRRCVDEMIGRRSTM